jgi:hypothetical protein
MRTGVATLLHILRLLCFKIYYDQVREFASNWKSGISQINENVLLYFASRRNGMEILKQVGFILFYCYWALS